jgi:hypothetical protein
MNYLVEGRRGYLMLDVRRDFIWTSCGPVKPGCGVPRDAPRSCDTLTDIALPVGAIAVALLLFGVFVWFAGSARWRCGSCCSRARLATGSPGRTRCSAPRR